jgi:hypothetical protein
MQVPKDGSSGIRSVMSPLKRALKSKGSERAVSRVLSPTKGAAHHSAAARVSPSVALATNVRALHCRSSLFSSLRVHARCALLSCFPCR